MGKFLSGDARKLELLVIGKLQSDLVAFLVELVLHKIGAGGSWHYGFSSRFGGQDCEIERILADGLLLEITKNPDVGESDLAQQIVQIARVEER